MKGDFTRDTFSKLNHFTRVLMQQGRVQLDADWNEQVAILLHYLRSLAANLIGEHGTPASNPGFTITPKAAVDGMPNFSIGLGHYYVNGLLCENDELIDYIDQPGYPFSDTTEIPPGSYLIYLEAWERHITPIENDHIREVALGGPDTATRAQIAWQIKMMELTATQSRTDFKADYNGFLNVLQAQDNVRLGDGRLAAMVSKSAVDPNNPCITSPEARYRGAENQLYRVEIHKGGTLAQSATFKWSRENGSVGFPIRQLNGKEVKLEHLGRDRRLGLKAGDWVEIVDDDYVLQGRAEPLCKVIAVDSLSMQATLEHVPNPDVGGDPAKHPLLRRWDHQAGDPSKGGLELQDGAAKIKEGTGEIGWLNLEDGIQIQFQAPTSGENHYRTGDYWLLPARTATGDLEWPEVFNTILNKHVPQPLSPHGVEHYFAPLTTITVGSGGSITGTPSDWRRKIGQLWS